MKIIFGSQAHFRRGIARARVPTEPFSGSRPPPAGMTPAPSRQQGARGGRCLAGAFWTIPCSQPGQGAGESREGGMRAGKNCQRAAKATAQRFALALTSWKLWACRPDSKREGLR